MALRTGICYHADAYAYWFQSALRINGPSNHLDRRDDAARAYVFQSALRINGPSNRLARELTPGQRRFQSALRINGPSNRRQDV